MFEYCKKYVAMVTGGWVAKKLQLQVFILLHNHCQPQEILESQAASSSSSVVAGCLLTRRADSNRKRDEEPKSTRFLKACSAFSSLVAFEFHWCSFAQIDSQLWIWSMKRFFKKHLGRQFRLSHGASQDSWATTGAGKSWAMQQTHHAEDYS